MSAPLVELGHVCCLDRQTVSAGDAICAGRSFVGMEHVDPATGRIAVKSGSRTGDGKSQAFLFDSRHVLFGKLRPYLRKIALPEIEGCSSTELVPLLPDPVRLDRGYLFHWVRRNQVIDALMAKNTGARMPRADMGVLLGMMLPLPPLDEQRRIVGLLDRAAEIRRRAEAASGKARAVIPALFLDIFGDPVTNPKNWPATNMGSVLDRIDGGWSPVCADGTPSAEEWGVLKLSAIKPTGFFGADAKRLPEGLAPRKDLEVVEGDLLFTRKNTVELVGTAAVANRSGRKRMLPDTMFRLVPKRPASFVPRYLSTLINLPSFRPTIQQLASGSASSMPGISKGRLSSLRIPIPDIGIQEAFGEQVQRLEAVAHQFETVAARADALAHALSAEVFG